MIFENQRLRTVPRAKRSYQKVTEQQKQSLIRQVFGNKLSIRQSAKKIGLNDSTAKVLIRKFKKQPRNEGYSCENPMGSAVSQKLQSSCLMEAIQENNLFAHLEQQNHTNTVYNISYAIISPFYVYFQS